MQDSNCTLLRYFLAQNEVFTLVKNEVLDTKAFTSIVDCMRQFLDGASGVVAAVIGIAGPVTSNTCDMTNSGWKSPASGAVIQAELGIGKVLLLNDFEAAGYGVLDVDPANLVSLTPGVSSKPGAPKAVIGPGTGLGECFLTYGENGYVVWPSEGGHSDFAAKNEEEWHFANYMK